MFYFKYLTFTKNIFMCFQYYIPCCRISLLLRLFNLSSKFENKVNNNINNINDNNKINKYIKEIHKSVSIERIDDVNFNIDDGPIYI